MKRLTMIQSRLLKIGVLKLARFGALSRRAALALMIGLTAVGAVYPVMESYADTSSVPDYVPSEGTKFWVTFLSNNKGAAENEADREVTLVAAGRSGIAVTLTYTQDNSTETHTIPATGQLTMTLNKDKVYNLAEDAGVESGNRHSVLVTTGAVTDTISLYAAARDGSFYESTFVLPEHALGNEYVVQTGRTNHPTFCSEYAIVAVKNNTHLTIRHRETKGNSAALTVPSGYTEKTLTLNKGDVYFVKSTQTFKQGFSTFYYTLAGTSIVADSVFAVFQADEATRAPYIGGHTQNYFLEQALPISAWGKEFLVAKLPTGLFEETFAIVRITAVYDGTTVTIRDLNGKTKTETLSAFSTFEFPWMENTSSNPNSSSYASSTNNLANQYEDIYVTASHPVTVSSFIPNNALNMYEGQAVGAPAVACIPPLRQGTHKMTLGKTANDMALFFVNIVLPTNAVDSMKFDGNYITTNPDPDLIYEVVAFPGTDYSVIKLVVGNDENSDQKHEFENHFSKFILTSYGLGNINAYYYASGFNVSPAAPVMFVDDNEVVHGKSLDYCNRHPGIHFTGKVDYPHDSVRWDLGEGVTFVSYPDGDDYSAQHMYGHKISEGDTTHTIRFYVYRHSPLTNIKDTDSIRVALSVHPVYYDTLETWVTAKSLKYLWDKSSKHAFNLPGARDRGELDLTKKYGNTSDPADSDEKGRKAPIEYGANDTIKNAAHRWEDGETEKVIFDSLIYHTDVYDCDSIFYLKLHVTKNIIMATEYDTVCQHNLYTNWTDLGHGIGTGHKLSRENLKTSAMIYNVDGEGSSDIYATDVPGNYEIRDTLLSKVYPYPDSIHILRLHVSYKPTITIENREDSLCEAYPGATLSWTVNYTAAYADSLYYELRTNPGNELKRSGGMRRTTQTSFNMGTLGTLTDGTYKLRVQAFNDTLCESVVDEVPLVIKNRPSLKINPIAAQCYPASEYEITYVPTDAVKIRYHVTPAGSTTSKIAETVIDVNATKKFTISTDGWDAGKYVLHTQPISALGCDSVWSHDTITINLQPQVKSVVVDSVCDTESSATVTYRTQDADTCYYYIKSAGVGTMKGIKPANGAEQTFSLNVSALNVPEGDAEYVDTLLIVANCPCPSDTVKTPIVIHPMPTAKITSAAPSKCVTAVTADEVITYTASANTTQIKWQLTKPSGVYGPFKVAKGSSLTIPKAQLQAAGNYQLKIDSVWTSYCDSTGLAYGTLDFEIYDTASIVLNDIEGKCKGTALTATYTFPVLPSTSSYTYTVKTKAGALKGGSAAPITTIDGTIKWTGTDTLSAGKYVLYVQATNDHGCAATEVSKEFEVFPIPQIKTLATPDNVCETEVANREVAFTHSDAQTINYIIKKGSADWITGQSVAASAGKITVRTDTLSPGNYTIETTPVSEHSCTGDKQSVSFEVYEQPTIDLINDDAFCYGKQENLVVAYTRSANVTSFEYFLKKGSAVYKTGTITSLGSSFTIAKVDTLSVGEYILYAIAKSHHEDYDCTSKADTVQVTVNVIPTATITNIANACDDKTTTSVTCSVTDAKLYNYKIKDQTDWLGEWKLVSSLSEGSFSLGIGSLSAGDYTLQFKVKSAAGCESEVAEKNFTVYPLPEITLPSDTDVCYPAAKASIRYTANAAAVGGTYTYSLTGYGISTAIQGTGTLAASGWIEVNTSGLEGGHDYTVSITAVSKDPQNCNTAEAKTRKITIHPQPSLTLNDIADICEQTATVTATISSLTGATKYDYDVLKGEDVMTGEHNSGKTGSTITLNTANWAADTYTLRVTAVSDNGCGSVAAEKSFVINHKPTVNVTNRNDSICEGTDNTWTVHYTATHADSIYYRLLASLGTAPKAQGGMRRTSETAFEIAGLKTYTDGTYYLVLQSFNTVTGCESKSDTLNLVINNQPSISSLTIANECHPASKVTVTYTPVDAKKIIWTVDGKYTNQETLVPTSGSAPFTFDITTSGWAAGDYTFRAHAESKYGCKGATIADVTFHIYEKPTVSDITVIEKCEDSKTRVEFKHNDAADRFEYWIMQGTTESKHKSVAAITETETVGTAYFDADINTLKGNSYTIRILTSNATTGCLSDTVSKGFEIFARSNMHFTSSSDDLSAPQPYGTHAVNFADNSQATSARWYIVDKATYDLGTWASSAVLKSGTIMSGTPVASGSFNLTGMEEWNPGIYYLYGGVTTAHGCNDTIAAVQFTIYDPTTIKLNSLTEGRCAGDDTIFAQVETTYADTIHYVVKKDNVVIDSDGQKVTNQNATATVTDFYLKKTTGWTEGTYDITITAENTTTHSTKEVKSSFDIYAVPTASIEGIDNLCDYVNSTTVTYKTTDASTYKYYIVGQTALSEAKTAAASGTFTLDISSLDAGTYTLKLVANSDHCVSDTASETFVVYPKPTASIESIDNQCDYENGTTVTYKTTDATTYKYYIVGKTSLSAAQTAVASGTFTLDISSLSAGTYTLKLVANSANCVSDTVSETFTVYPKPAVTISSIDNPCGVASTTTVNYTTTDATTYKYYIVGKTALSTAQAAAASGSFDLNISGLPVGDYTLKMVANSEHCVSDTVTKDFHIYPIPTASIEGIDNQCDYENSTTVTYKTTDATTYKYYIVGQTTLSAAKTAVASGTFTLDISSLDAGTYTLKLVANSDHCVSDTVSETFTVYPKPTASIESIDNQCDYENNTTVTYKTTDATTYKYYIVGKTVLSAAQTAAASGTFSLDISSLSAGTYTLKLVANSANCVSDTATKTFTVYPKPEATIASIDNQCDYVNSTTVSYTTKDASTYKYYIVGQTGLSEAKTAVASGTFTLDISSLDAGTYTLKLVANSDHCVSDTASETFTVYPKPTASIESIDNQCDYATSTTVTYKTTDATTYKYYIVGQTTLSSAQTAAASGTFNLDISSLDAGTYTLKLVANSANCVSDTVSATFTVYPKPAVTISSIDNPCGVASTTTVNYTTTDATTYKYYIVGKTALPTAQAAAASGSFDLNISGLPVGDYTLKMVANSEHCVSDTVTKDFHIYPIPTASIEGIDNQCDYENSTTVTYKTTDATTYKYYIVGQTTLSAAKTAVASGTFTLDISSLNAGTYTLKLVANSDHCVSDTVSETFTVYPKPTASIESIDNQCDYETSTTVSYKTTDATTYKYYIVGKTALSAAQTAAASGTFSLDISSLSAGTYTLKLVANSANCVSDTATKTFTVYPKPEATIASIDNQCDYVNSTTVSYTTKDATTYKYYIVGQTGLSEAKTAVTSGTFTLDISSLDAGTYTLKLVANSANCVSDTASETFTVYPKPTASIESIDNQCDYETSTTVTYKTTDATTYKYYIVGKTALSGAKTAAASGTFTLDISSLSAGTYTLKLVANSANCVSDTVSATFTVYPKPAATIVGIDNQCDYETSTTVTFTTKDASTYKYYIVGQTALSAEQTASESGAFALDISSLNAGTYTLKLVANSANCVSDTATKSFTVYPKPEATIASIDNQCDYENSTTVTYTTKDASTYKYYIVGQTALSEAKAAVASGIFTLDISSLNAGTYTLKLVANSANCVSDTASETFTVYPKPTASIESIDNQCDYETSTTVSYKTTDATTYKYYIVGQTVLSAAQTAAASGTFSLDISGLDAGTYTLKLVANSANCVSDTVSKTFTIHPVPTLTIQPLGTICQDSTEVTISFSSTHADTVFYRMVNADNMSVVIPQDTLVPNTGKVTFDPSATGLNITGKFTFYATPKSEFGCAGAEQSYTFYVNPLPTIVLNSVDAITCEQDSFATVTYTASTNARTYAYLLKNKNGVTVRDSADQVIAAPYDGTQKTFKIDLSNLKADGSPYTLTAVATSDSLCLSAVSNTLSFEVKPKPQISELHVTDTCYSATKTRLTFKVSNTDNPTTYSYSIVGKTNWIEASEQPVAAAENDVLIDIDPTAWGAGTYTLRITANSPTCKSDTIDTTFKIKALPSVGLQVNDTCIGDSYVTVKFTDGHSDDADARIIKLTYNLERNGVNLFAEDEVVTVTSGKDTFHVRTDTLMAATYTLHVTPYSSHPCEGVTVSPTFTIHPLPVLGDLTLDPNPVCEGTDTLKVTFTHSGAAKYVYALHKQGSTAVLRADTVALAADGTATAGIALRSPDIIAYEQTYDVDVTLISAATCVTSKTASFYLHKNPVVSLLPATQEACQPVKEVKFSYVNEGADVLHYEVRNAANVAIVPLADKTGLNTAGDTTAWTITFTQPLDSGIYTIHVTPEDDYCAGDEKTITFRVDTVLPSVIDTAICFGETYDWIVTGCNGQPDTLMVGLSATTSQWDTLFCGEGHCNKVYGLNLTVYPEYAAEDAPHTICANEIWTWRGLSISAPGAYEARVEGVVDVRGDGTFYCDSVYRITVDQIIPELKTTAQSVCYGEPVVFNGKTYDNLAPGKTILRDTILSEGGCDSVYLQLAVTVGKRYYDSTSVVACDSYLWDVTGLTYTASGIYRDEQASVNGCDSVHVLNLMVSESYEFYETYDILDTELPFTAHEVTYKAAGVYDHNFKSTGGCDSTYHITINTHERVWPKDTLHQPICDSDAPFTWYRDGQDYSQSGWYSQKTSDSIHVLHLTVNKTYHDTAYVKACDSYAWEGSTYTASGTYSKQATSSCGCDSTKVLVLTLSQSTASTENHTVCQHELVSIGNRTYVAMGDSTFTQTLRNAAGCDSVITYNVTIEKRGYAAVETDAFCEGTNYVWNVNGHTHTYNKAGTYYDTLFHASGCVDTIYTLTLTAKPQYLEHEDVEVSELALPYTWLGHKDYTGLADTLLRVNGDYYDTLTTVSGCDSVHHIHFHVNFVQRDTTSATGCDSVKWNDRYYTETGLYSDTLFSNTAHTLYDTIHFCDITVKRSYLELETEFTICSNETINWHGQNYINLPAGDTTLTYAVTGANGCDSTHKVQVHVMPSYRIEETAVEVCPSELPYNWKGQLLTATGTYTDEHRSVSDCDSVHVLQFTVKPVTAPTTESVTICEGRTYEWIKGADTLLTIHTNKAGTYPYYHWYLPEGECDSTYHRLDMTVNAHDAVILTDTAICYGESFDWIVTGCNGQPDTLMRGLTESTHQTQSLPCNDDDLTVCDPIYELKLTVYPEYAAVDEPHTICANETWTWRGLSISAPGEYVARVEDAVDVRGDGTLLCDSVYRITVDQIVPQSMSSSKKICYGQSVIFNGKTYSDFVVGNNVLLDTIPTVDGCDSIYLRMDVTMDAYHYDSVTVSSCDEYTWDLNGQRYTTSGIYREVLSTADNCDDIHVLNLTIYPSYDIYETYDILETKLPFTVHQLTYTAAGEYEHTFKSVGGCDSTYHITINTHELILPRDTMAKVICESEAPFTWYRNGQNYSNSGTYSVTTTDSIHELHLTVNKTYRDTATVKACGSYTWHGKEYTASGTYTKPDVTACGCDSTEVLVLTIGQPTSATANVTACAGELTTVGTRTFVATANETFTDTLKNVAGCDSVVTYNLTVTPHTEETPVLDTFCLGTSYVWNINGHTYSFEVGGTYRDTVFDADGCATTISTLELTAKPSYKIEEPDVEVAEYALPYTWVGHKDYTGLADSLLTVNGDYYDSLLTQAGCDSIHHIHFHVGFVTRDTVTLEGCDSVLWNGTYYKLSGLYSDTVFTDAPTNKNYDVIHFGKLTVNHRFDEVETAFTTCSNETFVWHGVTYANLPAGDTTLVHAETDVHGCDSTYKVLVHVMPAMTDEASYDACPSELPYNWHGQLLTTAGTYTDSLISPRGCDSVFVLHFTVQTVSQPDTLIDTLCQGETKQWYDLSITATIPGEYTYYQWYTPDGECDSTYHRLNVTVGETYEVGSDTTVHLCYGDSYYWYGDTRTVPNESAYYVDDHTYTRIFDTIKNTVLGCDSLSASLTLIMHMPYEVEDTRTVCDSLVWEGKTQTESGTYVDTLHTVFGCDSIVTMHLTVLHSATKHITIDTCEWYYWPISGERYFQSTHEEVHRPQLGEYCDSVYVLDLTIRERSRDTVTLYRCDSMFWATSGKWYKQDVIDSVVISQGAANGCDRVSYLDLHIQPTKRVNRDTTGCVFFDWKGVTYTDDTVLADTVKYGECNCDSITLWHLSIHQPSANRYDTIERCRVFDEGGRYYTVTTDDTIPGVNMYGCDSLLIRHIVIHHPDTIYDTVTTCNTYTRYAGTDYERTYGFSQDIEIDDFVCDSVIMLHLTLNHDKDTALFVTAWDTYNWHGKTFTESTVVTDTVPTAEGCDSIITLNLILNSSLDTVETQVACETFYWPWKDTTYTETIIDTLTKRIDVGLSTERDSTRILNLTIDTTRYTAFDTAVCYACVWHGVEYKSDTTVWYQVPGICQSYDTMHLRVYHEITVEHYDTACDVMTMYGESFYRDTTITRLLQSTQGCDSTVNYHITISHRTAHTVRVDTCGSYLWEGTTYTSSGKYTKVLTGSMGCDSVVTLVLSIRRSYNHEFNVTSCSSPYIWDGMRCDTTGDWTRTYTSAGGCDSTVTIHLSLPGAIVSGATLDTTVCDNLFWHGKLYSAAGEYADTLTSAVTGCDSVVWLYLHIADKPTGEFSDSARAAYTWRGETYYVSGDYVQALPTAGCDSLVTLHLTILNPVSVTEIADTACDMYTWDAETFYQSGTYTRNFPTVDGRDSIVTLSLVINHDTTVYITDQLCDSVVWNGETYYETGTYTQVLQRASGCDSVVTLTLTVCQRFATSFTVTARDVYTWEDADYTESGEYSRTYQSVLGCDSTSTMHLTIISNTHTELSDTACSSYAWADSIFTSSTIHTKVYPAANGCDSVVTLSLIVHQPLYTDLYDTACTETYLFAGETLTHTGIYYDTLNSAITGCDSIVVLHLQWCADTLCADTTWLTVDSVCEQYVWEGETYNTTGTYTRHHRLESGCDSVVIMRLEMQQKYQQFIDTVACDSLLWKGDTLTVSGFYRDTLTAQNGCDSIVVLHAMIGHSGDSTMYRESCDGLTINGITYTESGTYIQNLTTTTGCDSTLTIELVINSSADTIVKEEACDTLLWNGQTLTTSGIYPMVLQTDSTGCDSVVNLHLIVYDHKESFVVDTTSCDSIIWGDEVVGYDTLYIDSIYTKTFVSAVGCDSIVTMNLKLLRHDFIIAPDTAACDSFVWRDKVIYESGTYFDTLPNTLTGCDSITQMTIVLNPTLYRDTFDTVKPPYHVWELNGDTIWKSGVYTDTVPSVITGCDSIVTLHLIITDSIILDPKEPLSVDTFGYCQGDTAHITFNLLKGHPNRYMLTFNYGAWNIPEDQRIPSVDTTALPGGNDYGTFDLYIPENCKPGAHYATLQMFDDWFHSEEYDVVIYVSLGRKIVTLWNDVVAINNVDNEFIGYQWFVDDVLVQGATKQYYSNGEELHAWYRARVQLADDSTWVYTCNQYIDMTTDSLRLIVYPTPAPTGVPVTIKAQGILLENLQGAQLYVHDALGNVVHSNLNMTQRTEVVTLPAGMYIVTLTTDKTNDVEKGPRTETAKFTVY